MPLKMRILCNINVTLGKLPPIPVVPCHPNGIGRTVTSEFTSKPCCVQDVLHIGTLLETHKIKGTTVANEVACTVTIPVSYTKEVPPEEIVSENFDLQRLANPLGASCTSRRPTNCRSASFTPKASTE